MGLILICGLSRAGKTTYSQRFENVLHYDCYAQQFPLLKRAIDKMSGDIVVDGMFCTADERKQLLSYCKADKTTCIWLNTSQETRCKRTNIPIEKFKRLDSQLFEPPTYSEGWDEIIVIGESNG